MRGDVSCVGCGKCLMMSKVLMKIKKYLLRNKTMIKKSKRIEEVVTYTIEGIDLSIIRNAVNYAWHRATKHGKAVAGDAANLQRIREELDIV